MRHKLLLFITLVMTSITLYAQQAGLSGVVIDAESKTPIAGATVILEEQDILVTTGPAGDFLISNAKQGDCMITILANGYKDWAQKVEIISKDESLGIIKLTADNLASTSGFADDVLVSESIIDDDEGNNQSIGSLVGATDNVYFQTANYDFNVMRFRYRGYDQQYNRTFINGVDFNEPIRGRFNYSMLGGLNQAFKNKTVSLGLESSAYGFGGLGQTTNISTFAKSYSPGLKASIAYTNANYYLRGMVTYSTGLNKHGWALTASAVVRYSDEGVYPGTFYNSAGYFLSLEKVFNKHHSLSLTTFGAPTRRSNNSATYEEAYELADNYRYNPNWGYQNGDKRSAKVVESFDPTAIINWIWTPKMGTSLNTGFAFRSSNYSSSALNWHNAADPRPDYYRYLPSYYQNDQATFDLYTDLWQNDEDFRQIKWNDLYQANYLNNVAGEQLGEDPSAVYILEKRHSNQLNYILNSTLNHRINDFLTLQGGVGANYTNGSYYKTIKDLLGGHYWRDIDQFAERDFPTNKDLLQNDLNNPDRKVKDGDRFGYDYNINVFTSNIWLQNMINLHKWDISYGANFSYTTFQREGKMRNGRAPENSYGKGKSHDFFNGGGKIGVIFKPDGRNNFILNASYQTKAPLANEAYISPRTKDATIDNLENEKIVSGDISYAFNYRRFKGVITGFWTEMFDGVKKTAFFDDQYNTFMNYVMTNVRRSYKGVEFGLAYKITPSITLSGAGTYARYQYKNRPTGTRSYENGMKEDITQTVYLKNFYVGGTPQQAYNIGIDWAAPGMWFFNINASWMGDSYVDISPVRHEAMPKLTANNNEELQAKIREITTQEKLRDAFVLNASIGKVINFRQGYSMNINVNVENLLNNRKIQTGGFQQGRFDYDDFRVSKFPNKYYYAQGIKVFVNLGVRF